MEETNVPSCFCGRPTSLRTARTDNNVGRREFVGLSIADGALAEGAIVGGAGTGGVVAGGAVTGVDKCGLPGGVRGALATGVATSGVLCLTLLLT
ncbi:hypothetical protein V6N13_048698 [Hibiscus sabdariffa]|uniref:Uncharacterized protein n=1 Tax=Hibiscus sabdariffa TaxID=183260 RepID=A0ABR2DKE5_9ROSI